MSDTEFFYKDPEWLAAINTFASTIKRIHDRQAQQSKRPKRILIVDDDKDDVTILTHTLNHFYVEVTVCRDSEQATEIIKTTVFDIVFIDQRMPKLSGLEVLNQTMPMDHTQFFIVSGFQSSQLIDEVLKSGALFLPKPVTERILSTFLERKK